MFRGIKMKSCPKKLSNIQARSTFFQCSTSYSLFCSTIGNVILIRRLIEYICVVRMILNQKVEQHDTNYLKMIHYHLIYSFTLLTMFVWSYIVLTHWTRRAVYAYMPDTSHLSSFIVDTSEMTICPVFPLQMIIY